MMDYSPELTWAWMAAYEYNHVVWPSPQHILGMLLLGGFCVLGIMVVWERRAEPRSST